MNRIFGTSTSKKPKPTLQDAINSVRRFHERPQFAGSPPADRWTYSLYRSQDQETRWRAHAVQRADEQNEKWAGKGMPQLHPSY